MLGGGDQGGEIAGYTVPVHRALTEPILLGGAPRGLAILNGTLAGAIGLGLRLWLIGIAIWAIGHVVAVIIIIATGLALAFGETSGGFRKLIQIVFGLSIAFAASSFFLSFFSFGGGALV